MNEARLANGLRLRYADRGPKNGVAVLMLHGITDSSFSFSRVLPLMPANVRVIVPDQRGHGDSDRPEAGYRVDDFAIDALLLLDALNVQRAVVVGHSMGSFVARRMAERAPDRIERLILVGSAPSVRNDVVDGIRQAFEALQDPIDPAFVREFQMSTVHQPVPEDFMDRAIAESRKVPARVWKAALAGLFAYEPATPGASFVPTLVLGGAHDAVFSRAEQEALAEGIPGASVQILSDIGHSLQWEAPERFVSLLALR
jgi:pimeloyl-ACP methyl ester carboxylesterase